MDNKHESNIDYNDFNLYQLSQFQIGKTIFDSIYGKFKEAVHLKTKENVIFQIIETHLYNNKDDLKTILTNIKNYRKIKNEYFFQLLTIIQTKQVIYLVFTKDSGIPAIDYIINDGKLSEKQAKYVFLQLLSSFIYLNSINVYYREYTLDKLYLKISKNTNLIDAKLSVSHNLNNSINGFLKTPYQNTLYAAPETHSNKEYCPIKSDIWSLGILLYGLLCGYLPFENSNNDIYIKNCLESKYVFPHYISHNCKDLISKMLNPESNCRIDIKDIISHKWLIIDNDDIDSAYNLSYNNLYKNLNSISGINVYKNYMPIDLNLVSKIVKLYDMLKNLEDIIFSVVLNLHNIYTTIYYLHIRKYLKTIEKNNTELNNNNFRDKEILINNSKSDNEETDYFNFLSKWKGNKYYEFILNNENKISNYNNIADYINSQIFNKSANINFNDNSKELLNKYILKLKISPDEINIQLNEIKSFQFIKKYSTIFNNKKRESILVDLYKINKEGETNIESKLKIFNRGFTKDTKNSNSSIPIKQIYKNKYSIYNNRNSIISKSSKSSNSGSEHLSNFKNKIKKKVKINNSVKTKSYKFNPSVVLSQAINIDNKQYNKLSTSTCLNYNKQKIEKSNLVVITDNDKSRNTIYADDSLNAINISQYRNNNSIEDSISKGIKSIDSLNESRNISNLAIVNLYNGKNNKFNNLYITNFENFSINRSDNINYNTNILNENNLKDTNIQNNNIIRENVNNLNFVEINGRFNKNLVEIITTDILFFPNIINNNNYLFNLLLLEIKKRLSISRIEFGLNISKNNSQFNITHDNINIISNNANIKSSSIINVVKDFSIISEHNLKITKIKNKKTHSSININAKINKKIFLNLNCNKKIKNVKINSCKYTKAKLSYNFNVEKDSNKKIKPINTLIKVKKKNNIDKLIHTKNKEKETYNKKEKTKLSSFNNINKINYKNIINSKSSYSTDKTNKYQYKDKKNKIQSNYYYNTNIKDKNENKLNFLKSKIKKNLNSNKSFANSIKNNLLITAKLVKNKKASSNNKLYNLSTINCNINKSSKFNTIYKNNKDNVCKYRLKVNNDNTLIQNKISKKGKCKIKIIDNSILSKEKNNINKYQIKTSNNNKLIKSVNKKNNFNLNLNNKLNYNELNKSKDYDLSDIKSSKNCIENNDKPNYKSINIFTSNKLKPCDLSCCFYITIEYAKNAIEEFLVEFEFDHPSTSIIYHNNGIVRFRSELKYDFDIMYNEVSPNFIWISFLKRYAPYTEFRELAMSLLKKISLFKYEIKYN